MAQYNDTRCKANLQFDNDLIDKAAGYTGRTWTNHSTTLSTTAKFPTHALRCATTQWVDSPQTGGNAVLSAVVGTTGDFSACIFFDVSGGSAGDNNTVSGSGARRFMFGDQGDDTQTIQVELNASNRVAATVYNEARTGFMIVGTTSFTTAGFNYCIIRKISNVLQLGVNGVQEGGDLAMTDAVGSNPTCAFSIGRTGSIASLTWNGRLDCFGVFNYALPFTVPSGAFDGWASGVKRIRNFVARKPF